MQIPIRKGVRFLFHTSQGLLGEVASCAPIGIKIKLLLTKIRGLIRCFLTVEIKRYNQKHHSREKSNDQTQVAESIWASKELLEVIESVPYCEQFIHCFEEMMPRGLGGS
nr:hypothetical protein CFP56_71404 [Quercus suber]